MRRRSLPALALLAALWGGAALADPAAWQSEWPRTDFGRASVNLGEIFSGGPPKDGIPAIDQPAFVAVAEVDGLAPTEPVISVILNGEAKAYPLQVLIWHEIVNDTVGGVPVAVTFCPLCNSCIAFDRRVGDKVLDFGTTGKLRHSDLVMYDRQTESWWQQFLGEAIVGEMTGARLEMLPARIESFARFAARAPQGKVLVPGFGLRRPYGRNPYADYDNSPRPFLYRGPLPTDIAPLARVVSVGDRAWSLDYLRRRQRVETDDGLVILWEPGQNSALDASRIAEGRDVGNVTVQRKTPTGLVDEVYGVDFAFAYRAFRPNATIVHGD